MKKIFCALILWFSFTSGVTSSQAIDVQDPQNLLSQVDQYLAQTSFTQVFQLGDDAEYVVPTNNCQMTCGADGCVSSCQTIPETMSRKVSALTTHQCTIALQDGTSEVWTEDLFNTLHGNSVRNALTALDQQIVGVTGTLEATQFRDRPYTMPNGTIYPTKEIVFTYHITGLDQTFFVRYTVSNQLPFVAQIVQMAIDGQWRYQLNSVNRE